MATTPLLRLNYWMPAPQNTKKRLMHAHDSLVQGEPKSGQERSGAVSQSETGFLIREELWFCIAFHRH